MSGHMRTTHWRRSAPLALGVALALVSGCEDPVVVSPPPTPAPAQPAPAAGGEAPAETPGAGAESASDESYTRPVQGNRRDPFTFIPPEPELKARDEVRAKEPLESYDVGQLKLVAIVTGTALPTAMFVDPSGFGHFAKEDDRIGRNGGRITDIRTNEVEITINPEGGTGAVNDLEGNKTGAGEDRPGTEPVTLVIRLSDTEIRTEDELQGDEASVLEKIEQKPEGEGEAEPPRSPLAP